MFFLYPKVPENEKKKVFFLIVGEKLCLPEVLLHSIETNTCAYGAATFANEKSESRIYPIPALISSDL